MEAIPFLRYSRELAPSEIQEIPNSLKNDSEFVAAFYQKSDGLTSSLKPISSLHSEVPAV